MSSMTLTHPIRCALQLQNDLDDLVQMWKGLEGEARQALSHANELVPKVEAAERDARSRRLQSDVAQRCS